MLIENLTRHEDMTDAILAWATDWISQDEFDAHVREKGWHFNPLDPRNCGQPLKPGAMREDDYILPSEFGNPQGIYGDFIFLIQTLVTKGYVAQKDEGGKVWYKAKKRKEKAK